MSAPPALLAAACGTGGDDVVKVASLDELEGGEPVAFELPDGDACFAVGLDSPVEHGVGPGQNIVAYSTRCPHMGCPIEPRSADPATGHFGPCACHQSVFDLRHDGRLICGRAGSNLARIELEVRGQGLVALRRARPSFGEPLGEEDALVTVDGFEESEAGS